MQIKVLFYGTAGNHSRDSRRRLLLMTGDLDLLTLCDTHTWTLSVLPELTLYTLDLQNATLTRSV